MAKGVTPKSENYSKWYTDVITKAELADYGPVKGTMVIRPYGYQIWDNVKKFIEKRKINERFYQTRDSQMLKRMWNIISHKTNEYIDKDLSIKPFVRKIIDEIKNNNLSIYRASKIIFQYISKKSIDI